MSPFEADSSSPFEMMASRDYTRQRQMGIDDLLLENRIVFLGGVITDGTANEIVMKLLYLMSENAHQDVHMYINSPGGSVTATLAIYDTMQYLECDIATYCIGLAASGGAVLVAGGTKGKRYALSNSKLMIHQPSRRSGRAGFRHRNSGQGNPQNQRLFEPYSGRTYWSATRCDCTRHRKRPISQFFRCQRVRTR